MEDCSRRHEGDTLRIGELLTLGEYRDGADRERAAGEQNGDPAGTEPRDWMRSLEAWLYRLRGTSPQSSALTEMLKANHQNLDSARAIYLRRAARMAAVMPPIGSNSILPSSLVALDLLL